MGQEEFEKIALLGHDDFIKVSLINIEVAEAEIDLPKKQRELAAWEKDGKIKLLEAQIADIRAYVNEYIPKTPSEKSLIGAIKDLLNEVFGSVPQNEGQKTETEKILAIKPLMAKIRKSRKDGGTSSPYKPFLKLPAPKCEWELKRKKGRGTEK